MCVVRDSGLVVDEGGCYTEVLEVDSEETEETLSGPSVDRANEGANINDRPVAAVFSFFLFLATRIPPSYCLVQLPTTLFTILTYKVLIMKKTTTR